MNSTRVPKFRPGAWVRWAKAPEELSTRWRVTAGREERRGFTYRLQDSRGHVVFWIPEAELVKDRTK